jgi:hypothetical protein
VKKMLQALALFAALTALVLGVTWPWARTFATGFVRHWDPPFHAWKLNLVAESILEGRVLPADRNSNVFTPSSLTLYYEALHWPQAVVAAALRLVTDNVVLVYHLVLVGFWALAGLCFFALCRALGSGRAGALLGAAVFTAMPYRTSYLLEFNMQLCAGLVLFLFFFYRFMREPSVGDAVGAGLAFWFQAVSELYQALIALTVLPLLAAPYLRELPARHLRSRATWVGGAAAALGAGGLCWYFLWPYQALRFGEGFSRSLREMDTHYLEPLSYLRGGVADALLPWVQRIRQDEMSVTVTAAVLAGALAHALLNRRLLRGAGAPAEAPALRALRWGRLASGALFALLAVALASSRGLAAQPWTGAAANLLAIAALGCSVAIAAWARERDPGAQARSGLAAAAALSFILALGPRLHATNTGWSAPNRLFEAIFLHLPLISGMRVISRFGLVVLIFLVVAAVSGYETLWRRRPSLRWVLLPAVLAAVCLESRVGHLRVVPFAAPWNSPAIAAIDRDGPSTLLIVPFGERDWDSQYMLGIAGSRRQLVYGWGGFYPPFQRALEDAFVGGDVARGLALARTVWPETRVLLDRKHLRRRSRRRDAAMAERIEQGLLGSCDTLATDERFTLLRIRPDTGPAPVFSRLMREGTLRDDPVVSFGARTADGGELAVEVTANGMTVGTLRIDARPRRFSVRVPPAALVAVRPNEVRVAGAGGAPFLLEGFRMLPAVPAGEELAPGPVAAK